MSIHICLILINIFFKKTLDKAFLFLYKTTMAKNRIDDVLKEKGKNSTWLASATGYKRVYISRIKNSDIKNPGVDICLRISQALGIPINEIWYL